VVQPSAFAFSSNLMWPRKKPARALGKGHQAKEVRKVKAKPLKANSAAGTHFCYHLTKQPGRCWPFRRRLCLVSPWRLDSRNESFAKTGNLDPLAGASWGPWGVDVGPTGGEAWGFVLAFASWPYHRPAQKVLKTRSKPRLRSHMSRCLWVAWGRFLLEVAR